MKVLFKNTHLQLLLLLLWIWLETRVSLLFATLINIIADFVGQFGQRST